MKNFALKLLGLTGICLCLVAGYNYWNDTSGLYNQDFSVPRQEPDQHFVKVRYLLQNPSKYDAYCFGSSRVGNIDLTKIDDGHSYYNMTYSEGLPEEWLADVKIMLKHHVTIKRIMVGCDDFSFRVDPKVHESQSLRVPYKEDNFRTYVSFLLKVPSRPVRSSDKNSIFDIYGSGRPLHDFVDVEIEKNPEKHLEEMAANPPTHYAGNYIEQTLDALRELKQICDANGIEFIVFINPINHKTYMDTNMKEFNEFKTGLADITDYYDFSGLNDITTNDYYYYETSHYRPLVGDMIVHRLLDEPKNLDTDFGRYVTKASVDAHIEHLKAQIVR